MRVKVMTGEFSRDFACIYDTEGGLTAGAVYSLEEVLGNKDNPQSRRALERGASLAVMDDINSPDFDEEEFVEELLYVREDHPVFNADLIGDWIYIANAYEPMDHVLSASIMLGIKKNY